jgi:hypothetical protein
MALTNAERQKGYRDRKRGGPPAGRWAGRSSLAKIARSVGTSRTRLFMIRWISAHAPEVLDQTVNRGEPGLKITPTYYRLKAEYEAGILRTAKERPAGDVRLVESRQDGQFVFNWVRGGKAK